ncbi:MAG TPA: DUF5652 family protein [Candidatus Paceibacterota bacterium]|nr:DUF5652 family protein [Candidatus Paceibacterota bacterium]
MYKDFLQFPFAPEWWMILLFVWAYVWKGLALWKAGRAGAKWWFIALLVVNTFGILEILYIYVFSQQKHGHTAHKAVAETEESAVTEAVAEEKPTEEKVSEDLPSTGEGTPA